MQPVKLIGGNDRIYITEVGYYEVRDIPSSSALAGPPYISYFLHKEDFLSNIKNPMITTYISNVPCWLQMKDYKIDSIESINVPSVVYPSYHNPYTILNVPNPLGSNSALQPIYFSKMSDPHTFGSPLSTTNECAHE